MSFERFNGILGATPMNGRSIEVQLMRKLIVGRFVWNTTMPCEFQETFLPFFKQIHSDDNSGFSAINAMYFSECASCHNHKNVNWNDLTLVSLPKSYQYMTLDADDLGLLLCCYKQLLANADNLTIDSLSSIARKYAYAYLGSEKFGSKKDSKSLRSSRVIASWANDDGTINTSSLARPGQVKFYILHSLTIDGNTRQFALACISWYKKDEEAKIYGKPTQVWRCKEIDPPGPAVFMPAQRIFSTFASCTINRNGIEKLEVSAVPRLFN
ncbi:uncharacterized protein LOC116294219 [Actinia tenebrosa]|uniref:Uncharacterized protein LOC116294219 n=1 Tax=Actinia tenebrosa TaxID=6105 RepID=A0A6P8HR99_ACTTE|nr:uncharacterized protein LOC116294219 [Actinia tenebrosa]